MSDTGAIADALVLVKRQSDREELADLMPIGVDVATLDQSMKAARGDFVERTVLIYCRAGERADAEAVRKKLHKAGCGESRVLTLPDWRDDEPIARYVSRFAPEAQAGGVLFTALMQVGVVKPHPADGMPLEADDDPHRLARKFLEARPTSTYHREEHLEWDGARYHVVPDKEVAATLAAEIKREFDRINLDALSRPEKWGDNGPPVARKVTTAVVGNATQAVRSLALVPSTVEEPAWLGGPGPFPAEEVLPTVNGLVHLPTLVQGGQGIIPPTPRFFSRFALDFAFDPQAPAPERWLRFLDTIFAHDPAAVDTLQEWIGYCLLPDTRQQKILALIGPKRSGKGTVARILRAVIGAPNVAGPTLSGLSGTFGLEPLLGRRLAIISDARLSGRADQAVIVERLLSISGEDCLTVDRKHRSAVHLKLPTRVVLISNELPRLSDSSGALAGRLILLSLRESFYGREDHTLTDKLMGELPGILLWAIAGWQRLQERGHFLQPSSGADLVEAMEDLASPTGAFLREMCEVGPGYEITTRNLYEAWRGWCEQSGRREPGTEQDFGRNLRAAMPHLVTKKTRRGAEQVRVYVGLRLRLGVLLDPQALRGAPRITPLQSQLREGA